MHLQMFLQLAVVVDQVVVVLQELQHTQVVLVAVVRYMFLLAAQATFLVQLLHKEIVEEIIIQVVVVLVHQEEAVAVQDQIALQQQIIASLLQLQEPQHFTQEGATAFHLEQVAKE
jgi:hypothetical protein